MMRLLSAQEAAWMVPLADAADHERDAQRVRDALEHARAVGEARAELERTLRSRLPQAVRTLLLGGEGELEERWIALFEGELLRLREASTVRVRLHPRWLGVVRELTAFQALCDGGAAVQLEPDADLGEHDVILHSDLGDIDALLDTRIAAFVEALLSPARRQP